MTPIKKDKPKLILVHGWGLNSAIWQPLIELASNEYDIISVNLSGYGDKTDISSPSSIQELAKNLIQDVLQETDKPAHWCAWSLGGMAAMHAAQEQPELFLSLTLLCTTPKFVQSKDWPMGVDMDTFQLFADQLKADYETGIRQFLLLQAGAGKQARSMAKSAAELLSTYPNPSTETLEAGLAILCDTDLRTDCQTIDNRIPCQIISGKRDRVIHPDSGKALASLLPHADFHLINSGHAPLLSNPDELLSLLSGLVHKVTNASI